MIKIVCKRCTLYSASFSFCYLLLAVEEKNTVIPMPQTKRKNKMTATETRMGSAAKRAAESTAANKRPNTGINKERKTQEIILIPLRIQERAEQCFVVRYCVCGNGRTSGL